MAVYGPRCSRFAILKYLCPLFQSPNFNLESSEVKNLISCYDCQEKLAASGFHLGGQKYFYLRLALIFLVSIFIIGAYFYSGDDNVVRGKQGKGGVHVMKTCQVQQTLALFVSLSLTSSSPRL